MNPDAIASGLVGCRLLVFIPTPEHWHFFYEVTKTAPIMPVKNRMGKLSPNPPPGAIDCTEREVRPVEKCLIQLAVVSLVEGSRKKRF